MSNINTILNKLEKIEEIKLAKHEVELGLTDDLKKVIADYKIAYSNYESVWNEHKQLRDKLLALKAKAKGYYAFDKKVYADAQKIINNIKQQAKDLGIDPNGIPGIKELYQLIDDSFRSYKKNERYWYR